MTLKRFMVHIPYFGIFSNRIWYMAPNLWFFFWGGCDGSFGPQGAAHFSRAGAFPGAAKPFGPVFSARAQRERSKPFISPSPEGPHTAY